MFVVYNFHDSVSSKFVTETLKPILHKQRRSCRTLFDFGLGEGNGQKVNDVLKHSKLVIIIVSTPNIDKYGLHDDSWTAIYNRINEERCGIVPVLLEEREMLLQPLKGIIGIQYIRNKAHCNKNLSKDLKRALEFQDAYVKTPQASTTNADILSNESKQRVPDFHWAVEKVKEAPTNSETENDLSDLDELNEENSRSTSDTKHKYRLDIFEAFRSGAHYQMRDREKIITTICILLVICSLTANATLFLQSLYYGNSHTVFLTVITLVIRVLVTVSVALASKQVFTYLTMTQSKQTTRTYLDAVSVKQIGDHMIRRSLLNYKTVNTDEIFLCLRQALRSVVVCNLYTAWLYPVTMIVILHQLGYVSIVVHHNLSNSIVSLSQILNIAVMVIAQGFIRTMIGIHHYERNLLIESHRMLHNQKLENRTKPLVSSSKQLQERTSQRAAASLPVGIVICLCTLLITLLGPHSSIGPQTGVFPTRTKQFALLISWMLLVESLMSCPTRSMKITAVAINTTLASALIYSSWSMNYNPHFKRLPTHFLPFIELTVLCLLSAFYLMLNVQTSAKTMNWPLPTLKFKENIIKQTSLVVISICLLIFGVLLQKTVIQLW